MTDQPQITKNFPNVKIIGKAGSATAYKIRDYLQRSDVSFEWIEVTNNEQARTNVGVDSLQDSRLPVCVFPTAPGMECPTVRQITEKLGWFRDPSRSEYDLAIYGSGPCGP
jgi:thioredoxin reductase (NADPH)